MMDRKVNYLPVSECVARQRKKPLAQGSLRDSNLPGNVTRSSAAKTLTNVESGDVGKRDVRQPKVVCHSPMVVHSNINKSKSATPEKVVVDVPPTLFITNHVSSEESINSDSGIHNSINLALRDQINASSTARPVFHSTVNEAAGSCLHAENVEFFSQESTVTPGHVPKIIETKENMVPKDMTKKRKPASKVIASRYMTSKAAATKNVSRNVTYTKSADISKCKASAKPKVSRLQPLPVPKIKKTPNNKKDNKDEMGAKASTPSAGFKTFFESDMSTIDMLTTSKPKAKTSAISINFDNVTQDDLNLAYSRHIRMAYVNSSIKKSSSVRQKTALSDVTKLCNANEKLQQEVADLDEEVFSLEQHDKLLEQLDAQVKSLGPVVNKLEGVQSRYNTLLQNVDTTRHGLPVADVVVPSVDHLELTLQQTQNVLADLSTLTYSHIDSSSNAAKNASKVCNLVNEQIAALNLAEKDADVLKHISVKDASLRLQLKTDNPTLLSFHT